MSRALLACRLALRIAGPRLLVRLLPGWALLGFLLTQLYDVLDWRGISRWLSSLGPVEAAVLVGGLTGVWCAVSVPAVRGTALGRDLDLLWRQPLGPAARALVVAPFAVAVALPAALPSLLVAGPHPGWRALLWLALVPVPALALAGGSVGLWGLGVLAAMVAVGVERAAPGSLPLLAPAAATAAVLALGPVHARVWRPRAAWLPRVPGRPRTPVGALLRRDAHALLREEPRAVVAALAPALPVALCLVALELHGDVGRGGMVLGALVFLSLSAPLGFMPVYRLVHRLGERLDPPAWPVSPRLRALALVTVGCLGLSPAWAGTLAGVGPAVAPLSLSLCLGAGAAWLSVARAGFGAWLWWVLAGLGVAALPAPLGWSLALVVAAVATLGTVTSLARRRP